MFVDEVLFILFIKNIQSLSTRLLSWCLRAVVPGPLSFASQQNASFYNAGEIS
jgi:hypothetical protein